MLAEGTAYTNLRAPIGQVAIPMWSITVCGGTS